MKKTTIFELCASALMTALVSVLGPIAFPIGPVPVSLTILPLLISVWLLSACRSFPAIRAVFINWRARPAAISSVFFSWCSSPGFS